MDSRQRTLLIYNNGEVRSFPRNMILARVKLNFELFGVSRPTQKGFAKIRGLPDTRTYIASEPSKNGRVILTPRLQQFWYDENVKRTSSRDKRFHDLSFLSLTTDDRYATNGAGSSTRACYPVGTNLEKRPMEMNLLLTGGAVIELVSTQTYTVMKKKLLGFKCIDALHPEIEKFNSEDYPYRWYEPTNSVHVDGNERISEPFGQYDNLAISPIMLPGTDIAWIDPSYIDILNPHEFIPRPFTMEWAYR